MRYESFSIRIGPSTGSSYAVSIRSPQGEGHGTFHEPEAGEVRWTGSRLWPDRTGPSRDLSAPLSSRGVPPLEVGKELFRALFREEVANLFHASLGGLHGRQQGLRIDISINPRISELGTLQKLPWELLCHPETQDFLCLSRRTPVVRSLDAHRERRSAPARPRRLRILAMAASPTDSPLLEVERERSNLEEAWKGQEKSVEIVFLKRGGVEEIRRALLAAPFHILHFMGHGMFDQEGSEGSLFFEGNDGSGQAFEGRRLAQLLRDFESLRLVVLNACHTAEAVGTNRPDPFAGTATSLVMGGVPAVVAMNGPISDVAAVAFSRTFYQRLAAGDTIEAAVTEGRLAILRADPEDGAWAKPALFLRSQDGMLFAPRSRIWARRASLLAGLAVALALLWILAAGWRQERRTGEAMRLANDGIGLLELGRKGEARDAFRSALDIDPDNAAVLGDLAAVEMQLGDDEAALAHAQAAVRAAPREAVHHYNLGNLMASKKRYEDALSSLIEAITIDPDFVNAYNELGNVYLDLDRPTEARKAFEAGLSRDPTAAKLHKNLARAALAEGHPEEAALHLEKALSLYPPDDPAGKCEADYWLAFVHSAAGRVKEACAPLREFAALDPHLLSPFAKKVTFLAKKNGCPHVLD